MSLEGQQLGRYRLLSILGRGGMGEVYLAEDMHIRRQVAVKVIRAEADPPPNPSTAQESARLFRREVRAIAMLDHPHILPLFDYGEENINGLALTYMVMPLRQEGSLATWLQKGNGSASLSPQDVVHFIRQAANALQYAHRHQVIHQDVKPSNFLIRSDEENPNLPDVLLADFGIAKLYSSTSSMSQTSRGTPTYMAPEQWSGQPVPATDQYALAVMAYQLLTGNPPFQGRQEQVMFQHFQVQPKPPSTLNPRIPAEVDAVILRALAKKAEERFASISAFARALQQALQSTKAPTIERAPNVPSSNDLRATLAISEAEAVKGTMRTLTLPGGRKANVEVPANVQDGHTIRVESQSEASDGARGALFVTIAIKRAEEESASFAHSSRVEERTFLSDPGRVKVGTYPSTPPPPLPHINGDRKITSPLRRLPKGRAALFIGIALLVVVSGLGTFYFRSFNYIQRINLLNAAVPNPYPPNSGTLAFNDPLNDNSNGYFWNEGSDTGGDCTFAGGAYHVNPPHVNTPNVAHNCTASTNFSNFAYQVQMTIIKGDCGGTIFRADSANSKFYSFRICQDGSYNLYVQTDSQDSQTLVSSSAPTIDARLGKSNLIAVVANANTITLYVNKQQITSVTDSTYSQGQIGVIAESLGNPTEVAFSDAKVWTF